MHDYVCFNSPIDYTLLNYCSNFILKWFQPNYFGQMCFLEEGYEKILKIPILKILRVPSIQIEGVCL